MKQKRLILIASLAVALVLGVGIAPASAYFTATTRAAGEFELNFKPSTEITESYYDGVKYAVISNKADSAEDVVVRARVYTTLEYTAVGDGWSVDEDWYYYGKKLKPGEDANTLTVTLPKITQNPGEHKPSDIGEMYNVIIVYEALPASQATIASDGTVTTFPSDWQ